MQIKEQLFFTSPPAVRKAMLFLVAGWVSLLTFIYHINMVFPEKIHINLIIRVAIVGLVICYFVFRIKPWARILCIFINIGAIGISGLFVAPFLMAPRVTSPNLVLHALLTGILFAVCTYFLMTPPAAMFFRSQLPPKKSAPEEK